MIVIIYKAWNDSFVDELGNRKVIVHRGWFPLNKNHLLLESLRKTITPKDIEWKERCETFPSMRIQKEKEVSLLQDPH